MPKILFSCTSLVSTFIELSTNNVISILKSKVYDSKSLQKIFDIQVDNNLKKLEKIRNSEGILF